MFDRLRGRRQTEDASDTDLHKAALGGNGEAMATLYLRHGGLVYRFTLQMSRDSAIAEEVTQEVFLALLSKLDRFDPERGALATWLCGIARRQLWKHWGRFDEGMTDELDDGDIQLESAEDGPETWLVRQEAVAAVRVGIDELPVILREVVVLCELEEMSYEQAALVLEIPIGTVRSRLHRAKARLAILLRRDAVGAARGRKDV
jgi:RNA polymerase sigma-70 factor, ECF subfamily